MTVEPPCAVQPFCWGTAGPAGTVEGAMATARGACAEGGASGADATGDGAARGCDCTEPAGAAETGGSAAVVCGSIRAEVPNGFVKGLSAKRIVSELQAAA